MFSCIKPAEYLKFLIANHLRRRKIRLKMHNQLLRFVMCLGTLRMKKRMHMQFVMTLSKILMCVYHVSNVFVICVNCLVLPFTLMAPRVTHFALNPQRSPMEEEESYEKNLRPEDMLADEDAQYESEEENREAKPKEKPLGPPLEIEMPFCPPPADPKKVFSSLFHLLLKC